MEREARRVGKRIIGDKSPNTLYDGEAVRMMSTIYPDAKLIVIIRDGRDTILSHLIQEFIDHPERLSRAQKKIKKDFERQPERFYDRTQSLFTPQDLSRRAKAWAKNVLETQQQGKESFEDQFVQVKYEELLMRPNEVLQELWTFLGAGEPTQGAVEQIRAEIESNPDAPRQLEILPSLAGLRRKGGPGLWQELFTDRDREIFKSSAGKVLIRLGYENDMDW
jgi:hypothetical protein